MSVIRSMFLAFSMYSKIPVPNVKWDEKNMKYVLCFFPLVGIISGIVLYAFYFFCQMYEIPKEVFALVGVVIPILITGGIHLDGFMDTMDALHSYGTREKKLEILKDPHIGAFSVISLLVLLLLQVGSYLMISSKQAAFLVAAGFFVSRILSGLSLVLIKSAKKEGLLFTFSSAAHKKMVLTVLSLLLFTGSTVILIFTQIHGLMCIFMGFVVFLYYRYLSLKEFNGITGDLAGWFLICFELVFSWTGVISCYILP